MRIRSLLTRAVAPLTVALLMAGCTDEARRGSPTLSEPGLYPSLTVQRGEGGEQVASLALRQTPGGIKLESFQGELRFDAGALVLARVTLPAGIDGFADEVAPGQVRFVGTAMEGVGEEPLVRLHFTAKGGKALAREMFTVSFEEVASAADLSDLTASVKPQLIFQAVR